MKVRKFCKDPGKIFMLVVEPENGPSSEFLIWNGENDVATWSATGGNRGGNRKYEQMFDGNVETYWHGKIGTGPIDNDNPIERNTVTVVFIYPVIFYAINITSRPGEIPNEARYQNLCLYIDDQLEICTDNDRITTRGEIIPLATKTGKLSRKIELRFQEGVGGEIAEVQISYQNRML